MPRFSIGIILILTFTKCAFSVNHHICLSCDGLPGSVPCHTTQHCGHHEVCSINKYITLDGFISTDYGCEDTLLCSSSAGKRSVNMSASARSNSNDILLCTDCCVGDICNQDLCGQQGFGSTTSRGPICYACDYQQTPESCRTIKQCGRDEVCMLTKLTGQGIQAYKTSCQQTNICKAQLNVLQSSIGKRSNQEVVLNNMCYAKCCSTDLCNGICHGATTARPITAAPVPTTAAPVTKDACSANPCVYGTCSLYSNTYRCMCKDGYSGRNCEYSHLGTDYCLSNPCVHGKCSDNVGNYTCTCTGGYYGANCDIVIIG